MLKIEIEVLRSGYRVTVLENGKVINTKPVSQTVDDMYLYLDKILRSK